MAGSGWALEAIWSEEKTLAEREKYDVIVAGMGAAGSSAVYQLARRGSKVLGIDQFEPPHTLGSTHGETRITRQAIGEGDHYTPLSLRSYEIFRSIEKEVGEKLLLITGGLMISSAESTGVNQVSNFFETTLAAAKKYAIPHEVLSAEQIRIRFPQFSVENNEMGYYEFESGILKPEACIRANLRVAEKAGARLHVKERMIEFSDNNDGVLVKTDKGEYRADKLVLSVGPWLPRLVGEDLRDRFKVYRQVLYWFDCAEHYESFAPGKMPIFIWDAQGKRDAIYGFPAVDGKEGGIKIASEQYNVEVTPESAERNVSREETERMFEEQVAPCFPNVKRECIKSAVCLYTMTPDSGFVIDFMPGSERIIVCSPCSGHGFKHSAAVGECVAELARDGKTTIDIEPLRINRRALVKA